MNFMKDYILEKELRAMRRELTVAIVILLLIIGHALFRMDTKCCMYVQTLDGFKECKEYDAFVAMKHDAYHNQNDRVLYWWCELEELEGWKNDAAD